MLRYIATVGIKAILGRNQPGDDIDLSSSEHSANGRRLARARRHMISDLVRIREERGLTQSQVADAIGIHRSGVCKFEADGATANPTLEVLLRYAHAVRAAIEIDVHKAEEPPQTSHFVMVESRPAVADIADDAERWLVGELAPRPASAGHLWLAQVDEFAVS